MVMRLTFQRRSDAMNSFDMIGSSSDQEVTGKEGAHRKYNT